MTSNNSREKIEQSVKGVKRVVEHVLERSRSVSELREKAVEQLHQLHQKQTEDRLSFSEKMQSLAAFIDKQNHIFEESMAATALFAAHSTEEEPNRLNMNERRSTTRKPRFLCIALHSTNSSASVESMI
mmetsp:Transcript_13086/g.40303  ORF Transcript_13086/g.40303 Transcript_13086/m.40303 type:complete len:129 (+) Transcript_13086:810-1196(+)